MSIVTRSVALALLTLCLSFISQADTQRDTSEYTAQREKMVRDQIEVRGIKDKDLLNAMKKVQRHLFVPESHRKYAYADHALPIGEQQTISQPYIVALMTELLEVDRADKVLEIGTGSGYQAAILGELSDSVFTIEIIESLADQATKLLDELEYDHIAVRCGDGYVGWEEHAPFDAIIVTCAPPEIPQPLLDQLAEGGRMVIPVGTRWQELTLITNIKGELKRDKIIPVLFVPMTGKVLEDQ